MIASRMAELKKKAEGDLARCGGPAPWRPLPGFPPEGPPHLSHNQHSCQQLPVCPVARARWGGSRSKFDGRLLSPPALAFLCTRAESRQARSMSSTASTGADLRALTASHAVNTFGGTVNAWRSGTEGRRTSGKRINEDALCGSSLTVRSVT